MTLVPGLMDIHSHIFLHPYNETGRATQVLKEPIAYRSVEAVLHVRDTLLSGFTLLRDLGTEGAGASDVAIKRAIDEGEQIPGPRLVTLAMSIVATRTSYGPGPRGYESRTFISPAAHRRFRASPRNSESRARTCAGWARTGSKFMPTTGVVPVASRNPLSASRNSAPWWKVSLRRFQSRRGPRPTPRKACAAPSRPGAESVGRGGHRPAQHTESV